jgi:hypothetical protein
MATCDLYWWYQILHTTRTGVLSNIVTKLNVRLYYIDGKIVIFNAKAHQLFSTTSGALLLNLFGSN